MTIPEPFASRIARLRALLDDNESELLLADHGELMAWITGYTVSETMYRAVLVGRDAPPWMVLRDLDAPQVSGQGWLADVEGFADRDDPFAASASAKRCWSRRAAVNASPAPRGACWSAAPRSGTRRSDTGCSPEGAQGSPEVVTSGSSDARTGPSMPKSHRSPCDLPVGRSVTTTLEWSWDGADTAGSGGRPESIIR